LDRDEWEESPDSVDAFYSNAMNDMTFPAGSLQQPLYDSASPDAQNYGHIGSVMGHELIHGFDDVGRQFDGKGKLTDWWTPEDAERFQEKTSCEEQQYSSFTVVDGIKVNGKLTLGENTADSGGLRLAYVAFLADAAKKRIELNRNEDPYTNLQQFFLAYAQNWCGSARPQQQRVQGETDEHSPRQFRVNGVMQNMPDFGNAFHCKVGQSMMPKNRCRVW
jgi:endothelin-converting enzyme/putative endopeptidase